MENFIIGLFSQQLSKYIWGFNKEQVDASLLSGKGEIREVQVKVEPINDILKEFIPFIELASVYVSKLSFNAPSIRTIRKTPVEISIDEVHVVVVERLTVPNQSDETWLERAKAYVEQAKKSGSYGLIERIRDNITIDINRVYITFQPMGRFKTRKIGPWTPPAINLVFNNLRGVTVDEYGEEGTPDDVWRHNSQQGKKESLIRNNSSNNNGTGKRIFQKKTNMIFKKLSLELTIGIGKRSKGMNAKQSFLSSHLLFVNLPVQSHLAMHRRLRDNALLALQADLSLTNVELVIESETLPLLVHAMIGLEFCFIKDRSFVDPFGNGEIDERFLLFNDASPSYNVEYEGSESKENDASKLEVDMNAEFNLESFDDEEENSTTTLKNETSINNPSQDKTSLDGKENWPAFILPSGIIIFEKFCVSLSIHRFSMRAKYNSSVNGYLQFTMKGMVSEFIWLKADNKRGGFAQLTLSHLNLHESYGNKIRTIINGGNHLEENIYKGKETTNDDCFPSMETRDIRNDPFDLRTSFPLQTFGFKASIDLLDEVG